MSRGGVVVPFIPKAQLDDAARLRDTLQAVARQLSAVVKFSERRKRDAVALEAARIHSEVIRLLRSVQP